MKKKTIKKVVLGYEKNHVIYQCESCGAESEFFGSIKKM